MNRMFDKNKLRKIRKAYLTAVLWVLIIELIVWVLVILLSKDIYEPTIGKIQTMFLAFVGCALLNIGAFKCLELGTRQSRAFAITSIATAIIATFLDLFIIWEIVPGLSNNSFGTNNLSIMSKLTLSTALTAVASLIESKIFSAEEISKAVRNFLAGIVGIIYLCILVAIIGIDLADRLSLLVVVVPCASLLIYFVANRISELDKITNAKTASEKASNELKQRQELIAKKEVVAKTETEKKKAQVAAQPPLQAENMSPYNSASGVRIEPPKHQ